MKEKAFVDLFNTIQEYCDRSARFGKAVSDAWVEAGGERDFASPCAYEFLQGSMIDSLVKAVAQDFETEYYPADVAEDFINWWVWETDFGRDTYYQYPTADELLKDPDAQPVKKLSAGVCIDGVEYVCDSASAMYKLLLIDQLSHENNR
jgi:hypothetical protein